MDSNRSPILQLDWLRYCPGLLIFRALRLAASPANLALGFAATAITLFATWLIGFVLLNPAEADVLQQHQPTEAEALQLHEPVGVVTSDFDGSVGWAFKRLEAEYSHTFRQLFSPSLKGDSKWQDRARFSLAHCSVALVYLVLASLVGGAICRRALAQLAGDQAPPGSELMAFLKDRWLSLLTAPIYPLLGIALLSVIFYPASWLIQSSVGIWIVAIGLPIILVFAVAGALLAVGTYLGWPLFLPAIAAERDADAFDAFGRAFSYVLGRPLSLLFYLCLLALGSLMGTALVTFLVQLVWKTCEGLITGQGDAVFSSEHLMHSPETNAMLSGKGLISFWHHVLLLIPQAYQYSYFWCAASALYLVMRQEVDGKAMDEISRADDPRPQPPQARPVVTPEPVASATTPAEESDQPVIDNS